MAGTEIVGGGGGRLYLTLHCYHQNDFCIKTGSDESRFNTSLIAKSKVVTTVHTQIAFEEKEPAEPVHMCVCSYTKCIGP